MTESSRAANLSALSTILEAELTAAYGRKTSLESRAGSIVVAAGAVVTVFLTLREALGLDLALLAPWPAGLVLVGLILSGCALLAGIGGALPLKYISLRGNYLRVLLQDDVHREDLKEELLDLRAIALDKVTSANAFKGLIVFVGYALIVVAVVALALALVIAGRLFG